MILKIDERFGLLVSLLCCCALGCTISMPTLSEYSANRVHEYRVGDNFAIALSGTSPVAMWQILSHDKNVLSLQSTKWKNAYESDSFGALYPGTNTFTFKASKVGKTTIVICNLTGLSYSESAKKRSDYKELKFEIKVVK